MSYDFDRYNRQTLIPLNTNAQYLHHSQSNSTISPKLKFTTVLLAACYKNIRNIIRIIVERLRKPMEQITGYLLKCMGINNKSVVRTTKNDPKVFNNSINSD